MKAHIQDYRARLEKELVEYLALPASEKSAKAVDGMLSCWEHIRSVERCLCGDAGHQSVVLSAADLTAWNSRMDNADGTRGGHWTISQTSGAAQSVGVAFEHITPVISTKSQKVPLLRYFLFYLHVFYTILLRISIARSSSFG